jgi:hypothetical protein
MARADRVADMPGQRPVERLRQTQGPPKERQSRATGPR